MFFFKSIDSMLFSKQYWSFIITQKLEVKNHVPPPLTLLFPVYKPCLHSLICSSNFQMRKLNLRYRNNNGNPTLLTPKQAER